MRQLSACSLECAFGVDENDLVFSCHPRYAPEPGYRVYVAGTEFGGVVDAVKTTVRGERRDVECSGRTWHGILAGKRLVPDGGTSHIRAAGNVGDALADLVRRCGLEGLFEVEPNAAAVDYTYERFCDAWSGLLGMLRSSSMRPFLRYSGGRVLLSAVPSRTVGGRVDDNVMDFEMERVHRCVNHLICGGTGEAENRTIIHFYADARGVVSHEQTFFGADEIAAFYDYSNADEGKLEEEGRKKLEKLQTSGEIDVDTRGDIDAGIGDAVTARDNATGVQLTALVEKKTATLDGGRLTVSYELGKPSIGTSAGTMSGTAESGGGRAYRADGAQAAAGFLAAHPVGFIVRTDGVDPNAYGGRWERVPTGEPDTWLRKE
ncbi:MAG: hypothetical protein Q4B35_06410 [Slackia sp.]|nr:hypothetical protein [Slackia sp.]